jgi:hypothetical protein
MTMDQVATMGIDLQVSDVSGQRVHSVHGVPVDATVGEFVQEVLASMKLPRNDTSGRPVVYHARLDREGRHLHGSEIIGEALKRDDRLVLHPNIDAGGSCPDEC